MANKARGFGLTAELNRKRDGKWDLEQANEVIEWIVSVLNYGKKDEIAEDMDPVKDSGGFLKMFKDGTKLCHTVNAIQADSVKKINTSAMAFKQMENIGELYFTLLYSTIC